MIIYHYMTSYGYTIMIIDDSCMIWFHFDCIMQLKKSYYTGRKSATTFGDLPDCLGLLSHFETRENSLSPTQTHGEEGEEEDVTEMILQSITCCFKTH